MKATVWIATLLSLATLFWDCKKNNLDIQDGTYKGKFTVTYRSRTETGETTLELRDGKYTCSGNTNGIPAGGSGTFSSEKSKITFRDENIWTANFDWNLILDGQYDYKFDGNRLVISAEKNDVGKYEYELFKHQ